MNLTCVKCNSVLDKSRVKDIEVDLCPACGGLWLDPGELERLTKVPRPDVEALRRILTGGQQAGFSDTPTACPACPGRLEEVKIGRITIERCKLCRGIFLDKGELDAALAIVAGSSVEQVIAMAGSVGN